MAMRKALCPKCNNPVDPKENFKILKRRKYHIVCYKEVINEEYSKHEEVKDDKKELYDYICEKFKLSEINALMKAQIDKYYVQYEFTYSGMLYSLKYFFEILENEATSEGIGIIPYIYDEAKEFYLLKNKLQEVELDVENSIIPVTVKIKPKNTCIKKLINLEEL